MLYAVLKALISGAIVAAASETARRSPAFGALIASLPIVSILGIVWLWRDTADPVRVAAHAQSTLWYVLPSLPFFAAFPAMLRHGVPFWPALCLSVALTAALYFGTTLLLARFGIAT